MKTLLFFANAVVFGQVHLEPKFHKWEQKSILENDTLLILILKLCVLLCVMYYIGKYTYLRIKQIFYYLFDCLISIIHFTVYSTLVLGIICSIYYLNSVSPETTIFTYGVRSVEFTFIIAENVLYYFLRFCSFLMFYYIYRFLRFLEKQVSS